MKFIYSVRPTLVIRKLGSSLKIAPNDTGSQFIAGTPQFQILYDTALGIVIEAELENISSAVKFLNDHKLKVAHNNESLVKTATSLKAEVLQLIKHGFRYKDMWWKLPL